MPPMHGVTKLFTLGFQGKYFQGEVFSSCQKYTAIYFLISVIVLSKQLSQRPDADGGKYLIYRSNLSGIEK